MFYANSTIDYTTGLIIAGLLLVVLWCLIKLDQHREAKAREKMMDDIDKQVKI